MKERTIKNVLKKEEEGTMSGITFFIVMVVIGILSGIVSAAAGLASLISYPSLLMMGLPPVIANVTSAWSTIGSAYSSIVASSKELQKDRKQMWMIIPLVLVGAIIGALLLFALPGKLFQELVPFCIAIAGIILLFPHRARQATGEMAADSRSLKRSRLYTVLTAIGVFIVGVYAGYFNAGAGVLMLTLLSVVNRQKSFAVNNALKNVAMTVTNTISVAIFAFETTIEWSYIIPLFLGNILGGALGPVIVRHLPGRLMQVIVGLGSLVLAVSLLARNFL
ncbi:membrane protein [Limosilactobacillus panis DSM 6035]|uniref:Probable membrane transporter protein n=2 Tax=Lactobacillaceae TaxID=33958 RepID=A0A0R1X533_9LACO|nr:membrane protein [Limosilactobacillus panis DSM 6035]